MHGKEKINKIIYIIKSTKNLNEATNITNYYLFWKTPKYQEFHCQSSTDELTKLQN